MSESESDEIMSTPPEILEKAQAATHNLLPLKSKERIYVSLKLRMAWYKKITVEVPLLLTYFSFLLMGSLLTNLIYYRACYTILGYDEPSCRELGRYTDSQEIQDIETDVQKSANIIVMVIEAVPAAVPVFYSLFAGAWSDRYGRKPLLVVIIAGMFLSMLLFGILICIKDLSPWYFLIATIPSTLTGSIPTYLTVTLAYINDISTENTRGIRMAIYEMITIAGMFCGTISSSYLLYATNYETCFFLATGLAGVGLIYTILFIPESLDPKKREEAKRNEANMKNICQLSNITDNFKTVFKPRDGYKKLILHLIIILLILLGFVTHGEKTIKFAFLRKKLNWNLEKFTIYSGISLLLSVGSTISAVYLFYKVLKIRGSILCFVGFISYTMASFTLGMTTNDYFVYGAAAIGLIGTMTAPLLRTGAGQIVPAEEMGKVFGLLSAVGSLTSLASSFMYTFLYNSSLEHNPATYNFASMGMYCIAALMVVIIIFIENRDRKAGKSNEEKTLNAF